MYPGLRDEIVATLVDIAGRSDGVRCDMAVLQLDDVVAHTWGDRAGPPRAVPFWRDVIARVRAVRPDFLFLAEAYWDREAELLGQGFDYCYDKHLADVLLYGDASALLAHLATDPSYQTHLLRFIENHDEARAAGAVGPQRNRAASVVVSTVPGALLLHYGQTTGRRTHVPVQVARLPFEPVDHHLEAWWHHLLEVLDEDRVRSGRWQLLAVEGWPDNATYQHLAAWSTCPLIPRPDAWAWPKRPVEGGTSTTSSMGPSTSATAMSWPRTACTSSYLPGAGTCSGWCQPWPMKPSSSAVRLDPEEHEVVAFALAHEDDRQTQLHGRPVELP
jgi:hypothetical protein